MKFKLLSLDNMDIIMLNKNRLVYIKEHQHLVLLSLVNKVIVMIIIDNIHIQFVLQEINPIIFDIRILVVMAGIVVHMFKL